MRQTAVILTSIILLSSLSAPISHADTLASWGANTYGQLGDGNPGFLNFRLQPYILPVPTFVDNGFLPSIAAGGSHSLAIKFGALYGWGFNADGELGDGTTTDRPAPTLIIAANVERTAAGGSHSLAVVNGGAVAWGYNFYGQVGDGTTNNRLTPFAIPALNTGVTAIAAGNEFSLAIKSQGVYAWGRNTNGQLGNTSTSTNAVTPAVIAGLTTGVTDIAAGASHALAIKTGGVFGWGYNLDGEVGNNSTSNQTTPVAITGLTTGVTDIAAGAFHSLAVKNGQVYAWGDNTFGQLGDGGALSKSLTPILLPGAINIAQNIVSVAASSQASFALASDGSLWAWGDNSFGELGINDVFNNVVATPVHFTAPAGYVFSFIDGDASSFHVLATIITTPVPVPEPTSIALLSLASASLLLRRKPR